MKLFILLLILNITSVWAQKAPSPFDVVEVPFNAGVERKNCAPVDLRNDSRWSSLPDRRHQDSTGWCYAYVLADIYSFENGANLSPADIALTYMKNDPVKHAQLMDPNVPLHSVFPLGGGFYVEAMKALEGRGICTEEDFPSEDYAYSLLVEARREAASLAKQERRSLPQEDLICIDSALLNHHLNLDNLESILTHVQDNEFRNILSRLSSMRCTPNPEQNLAGNFVMRDGPGSNATLNSALDQALDAQRPAGISMDSGILHTPIRRSLLTSHPNTNHAVSLVGRRFNETSGRCEYLLRNSDSSCSSYLDEFKENCENNHVWLPRELVRYGTRDVYSAR